MTPKKAIQFDEENPKIEDIIKALLNAKSLGYTNIKPCMVDGNYKQDKMCLEKLLRIYFFK